jgi:ATP-dependent exoDNAse (exonuclease V) beta subunit
MAQAYPRPGALFVVGDPKQSIYRFRRADIDTYNEVKKLIARSGGRVLHLTSNFRSVKAIGDWVNPVFKNLLPEEATSFQAAFTDLDTVRANAGGEPRDQDNQYSQGSPEFPEGNRFNRCRPYSPLDKVGCGRRNYPGQDC